MGSSGLLMSRDYISHCSLSVSHIEFHDCCGMNPVSASFISNPCNHLCKADITTSTYFPGRNNGVGAVSEFLKA
jgi:hypothetical protein